MRRADKARRPWMLPITAAAWRQRARRSVRHRAVTPLAQPGRMGAIPVSGGSGRWFRWRGGSSGRGDEVLAGAGPGRLARGWLRTAIASVAVLAAGSAVASWDAQYQMVCQVRRQHVVAAIEAAIPDAGALFFACLGIALALHGKRAIRPRMLNACCVGLSLAMNAIASAPGWRSIAVWVMPSAMYALASDTLITVIRSFTAGHDDGPLARLGRWLCAAGAGGRGLVLWWLRLLLAFPSTARGFRDWVIEEGPVAPGHRGRVPGNPRLRRDGTADGPGKARAAGRGSSGRAGGIGGTKREHLIACVTRQRGDLAALPLDQVPAAAAAAASEVNLHPGTARRYLRDHVLALHDGHGAAAAGR